MSDLENLKIEEAGYEAMLEAYENDSFFRSIIVLQILDEFEAYELMNGRIDIAEIMEPIHSWLLEDNYENAQDPVQALKDLYPQEPREEGNE